MDTALFLVKRLELQQRMERRRLEALENGAARPSGVLSWLMKAGASFVSGAAASAGSGSWGSSLLWSVLLPVGFEVLRGGKEAILGKLIHLVFPNRRSKESV